MRELISILTIAILISCATDKGDKCEVDTEFKTYFDNCMAIAEIRTSDDDRNNLLDLGTISRAIRCLEVLTGEKSRIKWECEGFGLYDLIEDFAYDKEKWTLWYEKNRCSMTMEKAEIIFAKTREPFPDYDDPKVLELVGSKFDEMERDLARYYDSTSHVDFWTDWPKINVLHKNAR